jgi:type II secretion system protein N
MKMNNKVLKALFLISFFILSFLIFFYYTFPYEKLKDKLVHSVLENNLFGIERLRIKKLKPYWGTGLKVEDINFVKKIGFIEGHEFEFNSIAVRIAPTSLINTVLKSGVLKFKINEQNIVKSIEENLEIKFNFSAYDGGGNGYIILTEPKQLMLKSGNMNLSKFKFLNTLISGSNIKGEIESLGLNIIAPEGQLDKLSGNIVFELTKGVFENLKVSFFKLPNFKINSLNISSKAKNGKLQINEFSVSGDIEGKIKGSIDLEPNIMYSKLNLNINLKPSETIIADFKSIIDAIMTPDASGYYNFKLSGSIAAPDVNKLY